MPIPCPWTARVWKEFHAGNLTRSYRDILLTLRTFKGAGGACWPAHSTLAARVKCSVRTVSRALAQADYLGLVQWTERRVRAGWRWLRTSNSYVFRIPQSAVEAGMRLIKRLLPTTGQKACGGESKFKQSKTAALRELLQEAAKLPNLLAARRAAMEARLLMGITAR